jgi:transcriptional regulator with XRE-family HTH domain
MARIKDKSKAIELRKKGMSYSQIKTELGISKSTLSGWLCNMPLSKERINQLGSLNPMRIERYRNTMKEKREKRWGEVYKKISINIGKLSKRELYIAGLFLYWGEGGKTERFSLSFSNTDPEMMVFIIKWMKKGLGIKEKDMHVKVHLYKDMKIEDFENFWSKKLKISRKMFERPYIKDSKLVDLSYKNGFGKGTCNIRVYNRDKTEYVMQGLKYISKLAP